MNLLEEIRKGWSLQKGLILQIKKGRLKRTLSVSPGEGRIRGYAKGRLFFVSSRDGEFIREGWRCLHGISLVEYLKDFEVVR